VIEVHLDLGGYPVTLLDTAGIRESEDPVEREGIARAKARAAGADLVLWLTEDEGPNRDSVGAEVANRDFGRGSNRETWLIRPKSDLRPGSLAEPSVRRALKSEDSHFYELSAVSGEGIDRLLADLTDFAKSVLESREPALVTRERQRHLLEQAESALKRAIAQGEAGREDTFAEELRVAAQALGRLTGRVDVEDVLDKIFRDFCIGK
jgi:tRNA modification GTPase